MLINLVLMLWLKPVSYTHLKTVTVTVRQSGSVNLNGSSRLNGTAYAGGNIGAKKTEVALTGEEKPELRVNAKTGRWELPVSYTHLDVYKRQTIIRKLDYDGLTT